MKHMDSKEVEAFIGDKDAGKEHVRKYGDGAGSAPMKEVNDQKGVDGDKPQ